MVYSQHVPLPLMRILKLVDVLQELFQSSSALSWTSTAGILFCVLASLGRWHWRSQRHINQCQLTPSNNLRVLNHLAPILRTITSRKSQQCFEHQGSLLFFVAYSGKCTETAAPVAGSPCCCRLQWDGLHLSWLVGKSSLEFFVVSTSVFATLPAIRIHCLYMLPWKGKIRSCWPCQQ